MTVRPTRKSSHWQAIVQHTAQIDGFAEALERQRWTDDDEVWAHQRSLAATLRRHHSEGEPRFRRVA